MRRAGTFLTGLSVGVMLANKWRSIAKSTIKAGMRGGSSLRTTAARAAENLADVVHEATWEMQSDSKSRDRITESPAVNGEGAVSRQESTILS